MNQSINETKMLTALPSDILYRILFQYSDGKCLSTLLLLRKHGNFDLVSIVSLVAKDRLNFVIRTYQNCSSSDQIKHFVAETLKLIANCDIKGIEMIKYISLGLAVLDYFERYASYDPSGTVLEFPIWLGFLSIPQRSSSREMVVLVKLRTPFLYLYLIEAIQPSTDSKLRNEMIDLTYQNRNFLTVPPLGRIEIVQAGGGSLPEEYNQKHEICAEISSTIGKMNTQNEILAPRPSWYSRNHRFSPFLLTKSQAAMHCPSFLKDSLDPYKLKKNNGDGNAEWEHDSKTLFCQWHHNEVDEQVAGLKETMIALTHFMKRLDTLQL